MKNILNFFKILEVEGLGEGNIKKIMETGNNSIGKIIGMSKEDFLKVNGFKEKMANKLFNNIEDKIKKSSIEELAAASNIFGKGFGKLTMEKILSAEENILTDDDLDENKLNRLIKIEGIGKKIAKNFVENMKDFKEFLTEGKLMYKLEEKKTKMSVKDNLIYSNELIILSEIKNKKSIEEKIIELGGNVANSMTKKVTLLITESLDNTSEKIKKAKENNIKIITLEEFNKIYNEKDKKVNNEKDDNKKDDNEKDDNEKDKNILKTLRKHINILLKLYPNESEFQGLENEIRLLEKEINKDDIKNIKIEIIRILNTGVENEEIAETEIENYESEDKKLYESMLNEYNF